MHGVWQVFLFRHLAWVIAPFCTKKCYFWTKIAQFWEGTNELGNHRRISGSKLGLDKATT